MNQDGKPSRGGLPTPFTMLIGLTWLNIWLSNNNIVPIQSKVSSPHHTHPVILQSTAKRPLGFSMKAWKMEINPYDIPEIGQAKVEMGLLNQPAVEMVFWTICLWKRYKDNSGKEDQNIDQSPLTSLRNNPEPGKGIQFSDSEWLYLQPHRPTLSQYSILPSLRRTPELSTFVLKDS